MACGGITTGELLLAGLALSAGAAAGVGACAGLLGAAKPEADALRGGVAGSGMPSATGACAANACQAVRGGAAPRGLPCSGMEVTGRAAGVPDAWPCERGAPPEKAEPAVLSDAQEDTDSLRAITGRTSSRSSARAHTPPRSPIMCTYGC